MNTRSEAPVISSEQKSLWSLQEMDRENPSYVVPGAYRVAGPLSAELVESAWRELLRRHAVLRTRFCLASGELVAVVVDADATGFKIERSQLGVPGDIPRWLRAESARVFELDSDLPIRVALAQITPEDHVLLVCIHHIAVDGWSVELLRNEFWLLYGSYLRDGSATVEAAGHDYRDYAAWQRSAEGRQLASDHLDYWRQELADLEVATIRRTQRDPAEPEWAGQERSFEIADETAGSLRAIAERNSSTLYCVLLTAWQVLVSRHANEQEVSIGIPTLGRTGEQWFDVVGNFVNILPIRAHLDANLAFHELLRDTSSAVMRALEHQAARYEDIVQHVRSGRPDGAGLFQTVFGMEQAADLAGTGPAGLSVSAVRFEERFAKYDLSVDVTESPGGTLSSGGTLQCRLVFRKKYFDQRTASRIAAHYAELLRSIGRSPESPVRMLSSVPSGEQRAIRELARITPASADLIHRVFEARASQLPDAVAVTAGGSVSYRELNERANRLARHLRGKGIGPETAVGISVERGCGLIAGMLAILKCGGVYVPLDPSSPAERIRSMVADAGLEFVLTDSRTRGSYDDGAYGLSVIDVQSAELAHESCDDLDVDGDARAAAYVIFTSGSTGRPKGVCVTHANVTRLLAASAREFDFRRDDVWTMFHSYAFDFSVWEIYGALLSGARLVVVPAKSARNPDEFLELVAHEGVTMLSQTPTAFGSLMDALRRAPGTAPRLRLRYVVLGGEKVDPARLAPWVGLMGDAEPALINMYGITETTVHVTFRRLRGDDLARPASSPIGRPLSDLAMYILDSDQRLAGFGVPGEIYVGGAGLARGYLHRPELTAERFVPNPCGGAGERLYRTGDLALIREDGEFEFIGRADQQVKVRGYRIELGEIEAAILCHADVEKAVVLARDMGDGGTQLIAYYKAAEGAAAEPARIRDHAEKLLPQYMMPAWFLAVAEFPLTSSGKLDVRRLPAPGAVSQEGEDANPATATPLTERLAATWKRVLKLENVGLTQSFFDTGGDSIRAVALVGALREEGISVSVSDIFTARNIARLTALITERGRSQRRFVPVAPFALLSAEDQALLPGDVDDAYPLSMTQAGMIYEMLTDSDSLRYHNVSSFRIRDDAVLSPELLAEAVDLVVGRHQILRASIDLETYSEPIQLIASRVTADVHVEMAEDLSQEAAESHIRKYMEKERVRSFDISRAPLFRIFAHTFGGHIWWLGLTECHVILEGWSLHSFIMEILRTYRELRDNGSPSEQLAPDFRFADYIAEEARAISDAGSRSYWKQVVESYPKLKIPRPSITSQDGDDRYELAFSFADHEEALRAVAHDADVPLKSVLHAIHLKALSVAFGQDEFYSGLVCDARPELAGADRVLGMYLNTVPFGVRCADQAWVDFAADVFRREVELWPYRQFPLAELQAEMAVRGTRLIDSFFIYLDFHVVDYGLIDYDRSIDMSPTEFGLAVVAQNGIFTLKTRTSVLDRARALQLMQVYELIVDRLARDPWSSTGLIDEAVRQAGGIGTAVPSALTGGSDPASRDRGGPAIAGGGERHMTRAQARLAALWEGLLDIADVRPSDDFFELGGNSMRAIRLRSAVQREFKVKVPLQLILERRNLAAIAEFIEHSVRAARDDGSGPAAAGRPVTTGAAGDLIWLADSPAERLAFCVHPAGGSSHWYVALAGKLSSDIRLAGFEPRTMLAAVPPEGTITDVAAPYQALIARICAGRPASLIGWSAAASLTWEIAVGLERRGFETNVLLIDPVASDAQALAAQTRHALASLDEALAQRNGAQGELRDTTAFREAIESLGVPWHAGVTGYAAEMLGIWKTLSNVMLAYKYGGRKGKTAIITSADCHSGQHPLMGGAGYDQYISTWLAACVCGLAEHRLPDDHMSILAEPSAGRIAAIFRDLVS